MKTVYYLCDNDQSMEGLRHTLIAPSLTIACNISGNLGVKHELEGIISLLPSCGPAGVRERWYCDTKKLRVVRTNRVE